MMYFDIFKTMNERLFRWGNPDILRNEDEKLAEAKRREVGVVYPVLEEGTMKARTFEQYQTILQHNGAPDIFSRAEIITDAGCGGITPLVGMREVYGYGKILRGFDIINVPGYKIKRLGADAPVLGNRILQDYQIEFYQGTYLNLGSTIPFGYDALVCIPSFNVHDWESSYPLEVLLTFYEGLNSGGMAQTLIEIPNDMFSIMTECYEYYGIPFQFHDGNHDVLRHNALYPRGSLARLGTLTIGPK